MDVRDGKGGVDLITRVVTRAEFAEEWVYQDFSVTFDLPAEAGDLEVRVWWHDVSYVRLDRVVVVLE